MKDVILENDLNRVLTGPVLIRLEYVLVRTNLSIESFIRLALGSPSKAILILLTSFLNLGKLKARVAVNVPLRVEQLPYDREVLSLISDLPGPIYLLSSASQLHVDQIVRHLPFVRGAYRLEEDQSDFGQVKQEFAEGGFSYIGRNISDLPIWEIAAGGYAVRPSHRLRRAIGTLSIAPIIIERGQSRMRFWMRLFGARQYYRLLLSLFPVAFLATSSSGRSEAILASFSLLLAIAIGSFIRHLLNIEADRMHPILRQAPLAAGNVPVGAALALFFGLTSVAVVINLYLFNWLSAVLSLAAAALSAILAGNYRGGGLSFVTSSLLDLLCIFGPSLLFPILSWEILSLQASVAICALLARLLTDRSLFRSG